MDIVPQKTCFNCKQSKPITEFTKRAASRDGLHPRCKQCRAAESTLYRSQHQEHAREYARTYRENNFEKLAQASHQRYARNREHRLGRARQWAKAHPEKMREYTMRYRRDNEETVREQNRINSRKRYRANPEQGRAKRQKWTEQHREDDRRRSREWRIRNPIKARNREHRHRARKYGNGGSFTPAEWEQIKQQYDHRCLRCGKREPEITLTVDHVVPVSRGGRNDAANLQPLCPSCNSSKGARVIDYRSAPPDLPVQTRFEF